MVGRERCTHTVKSSHPLVCSQNAHRTSRKWDWELMLDVELRHAVLSPEPHPSPSPSLFTAGIHVHGEWTERRASLQSGWMIWVNRPGFCESLCVGSKTGSMQEDRVTETASDPLPPALHGFPQTFSGVFRFGQEVSLPLLRPSSNS